MDEQFEVWTFVGKLAFYASLVVFCGVLLVGLYVDAANDDAAQVVASE